MVGMPKLQEQISAMAMDGRYAENIGANFGDGHGWPLCRKYRSSFRAVSGCHWRESVLKNLRQVMEWTGAICQNPHWNAASRRALRSTRHETSFPRSESGN